MERTMLERIEALLREDGFRHVEQHSSQHSLTLSASKGELRVVVHFTDQEEAPYQSAVNQNVVERASIKVRPTSPASGAAAEAVPSGAGAPTPGSAPRSARRESS